jgi:hypothetical protein
MYVPDGLTVRIVDAQTSGLNFIVVAVLAWIRVDVM